MQDNLITLADGRFMNALANNCTFCCLYLGNTKIGAEGAEWLVAVFKANQAPKVIWLGYHLIGKKRGQNFGWCFDDE